MLTRRELIRLFGGAAALAKLPACGDNIHPQTIFSDDELTMLRGFADVVIPEDDLPGGSKLGAVAFITNLITAFDAVGVDNSGIANIYAGGPFSGRAPFPDANGQASANFPPNEFVNFIELDRVTNAAWRLFVFGSQGLPSGAPNEGLLGQVVGLRARLVAGLDAAIATSTKSVDSLTHDEFVALFDAADTDFHNLIIELVSEAAFAAPEYGGNPELAGWKLAHFEGDIQPLGYSQWDGTKHVERPEAPLSTANPSDPEPLTDDVRSLIATVVSVLGGRAT